MTVPVERHFIELTSRMVDRLRLLLPDESIDRRYCPRLDHEELADRKITVYMETAERGTIARGLKNNKHTIAICVQQSTKSAQGPAESDVTIGDGVVEITEQIASYFQSGGSLYGVELVEECVLIGDPELELPDPFIIARLSIATGFVSVTYQYNGA